MAPCLLDGPPGTGLAGAGTHRLAISRITYRHLPTSSLGSHRLHIRLAIRLRDDVGGAGPALERELGPHVRVGNRLLHLELRRLDRPWGQALIELLEGLATFRERIAANVG